MRSYLGVDAHSNTGLELAVLNKDGELLWRDRCPLNSERITEAVQRAPRPCTVVFEQGELATWLHLLLRHRCERVVVADPRHNRLIATSADKSDQYDAFALAKLAVGGYLREVFQPSPEFTMLRLRVRHHHRLTRHVTAIKNQLKAGYRAQGVPVAGKRVFSPAARPEYMGRLPGPARWATEDLYALLDLAAERKDRALHALGRAVHQFAPAKRMLQLPQIGVVSAATFVAYLVTPERFPSRKHLWSYCGFGLMTRQSGHRAEPTRLRSSYNRHLKRVIKSAVERQVGRRGDNPFALAYRARLRRGMLPTRAKLTICRKLIDVLCAMWISQEDYAPDQIKSD